MQLKASAPGSLMLLGEYAVLHGYPALVTALNQRMTVYLTPLNNDRLVLVSDRYGTYETTLSNLETDGIYNFALETIKQFKNSLITGFKLEIKADFSDQVGFGSSAALVIAIMAALNEWLQFNLSPLEMLQQGKHIVQRVQHGRGSGADIAAAVYGGVIAYSMSPVIVQPISTLYPLVACYAGFKTKTAIAIQQVDKLFTPYPTLFSALMSAIGACSASGIECALSNHWLKVGKLFAIQQGLMQALQVNLPILQQLLDCLNQLPTIIGAKISGAGLGDCVIGLGEANPGHFRGIWGATYLPIAMSQQGVMCERSS